MSDKKRFVGRFTVERVNQETGEIQTLDVKNIYKVRSSEHFTMVRFTDGDAWIKGLKGIIPLLLVLSQWIDAETGYISLSTDRRDYICNFLGLKNVRSLTTYLTEAVKNDAMVRVNGYNNTVMINPLYIFRGSTADLSKKIEKYAKLKPKIDIKPNKDF